MNAPFFPPVADAAPTLRQRHDGWTPDRQRGFCEAIAEGNTVEVACARVRMAPSTAYALRRRAAGASFALAWDAARLLGRERLGDALHARAIDGVTETITRPDGSTITRHRFDTRLATAMLARADRHAEGLDGARGQAARLVAAEFDAFLDLLGRDEGPARAGLFLGTRLGEDPDALAPVVALARADTWLRTGAARGGEVDVADLDPAQRSGWTAEQWVRAKAAGLLALAAPPVPEPTDDASASPLSPLSPADDPDHPVWWSDYGGGWRTRFPPPDGFYGEQEGRYGDPGYSRELTYDEEALVETADEAYVVPGRADDERARDAWFAALAAEIGEDAGGEEESSPPEAVRHEAEADDVTPPRSPATAAVPFGFAPSRGPMGEGPEAGTGSPAAAVPSCSDLPNGPTAPI